MSRFETEADRQARYTWDATSGVEVVRRGAGKSIDLESVMSAEANDAVLPVPVLGRDALPRSEAMNVTKYKGYDIWPQYSGGSLKFFWYRPGVKKAQGWAKDEDWAKFYIDLDIKNKRGAKDMRTVPSKLTNACIYCNNDHDPAIQCRNTAGNPANVQAGKVKPVPMPGIVRKKAVKVGDEATSRCRECGQRIPVKSGERGLQFYVEHNRLDGVICPKSGTWAAQYTKDSARAKDVTCRNCGGELAAKGPGTGLCTRCAKDVVQPV